MEAMRPNPKRLGLCLCFSIFLHGLRTGRLRHGPAWKVGEGQL
jgi:hypothetical protein